MIIKISWMKKFKKRTKFKVYNELYYVDTPIIKKYNLGYYIKCYTKDDIPHNCAIFNGGRNWILYTRNANYIQPAQKLIEFL